MSLALKFTSLAIRTFSKPIANYIKRQAREHEGFKQTCVNFAQALHRVDMRWRIGLLQDSATLERQAARDAAKREAEKKKSQIPTVKTEAQAKAEEEAAQKEKDLEEKDKHPPKPKIKPLSEAKAIESGANFISETFLFGVAAGLILFESWRSGRKEKNRRNEVADRLADLEDSEAGQRKALIELEREVLRLRAKEKGTPAGSNGTIQRIIPAEVHEQLDIEKRGAPESNGWFSNITSIFSSQEQPDEEAKKALATNAPGPAEQVMLESDKVIEEKRRQRAIEDAENEAADRSKPKNSSTS